MTQHQIDQIVKTTVALKQLTYTYPVGSIARVVKVDDEYCEVKFPQYPFPVLIESRYLASAAGFDCTTNDR